MLRHVVLVRFKPDTPRAEIAKVIADLRALPEQISEIRSYEVGQDIVHLPRSFDLALVGGFDDLAALQRYQAHPAHVPVAARLREQSEQMVSVDYEA